MKLRMTQVEAMACGPADAARKRRLLGLRDRGYEVREEPGAGQFVVTDKAGGSCRVELLGLRTRVTGAEGATTELEQYPFGRVRRIVDPARREVNFERDADGRLLAIDRGPQGGRYGFELSKDWRPLHISYPDGTSSRAEYTPQGRPAQISNRDGTEIRYEYAPSGELAAVIDPGGRRTQITSPGPGNSLRIEYPDGSRHEFVEDPETGSERLVIDGSVRAEYRNQAGLVTARYQDGSEERFRFEGGRLLEASNEHATLKFRYDEAGRLLSEDCNGEVVRYQRNAVGSLIGIITPRGESLSYLRDRDQRLTGIIDWQEAEYRIELGVTGPATTLSYPNGVRVILESSAMGLPASFCVQGPSSATIDAATWRYDTCDRVVSEDRLGAVRRFEYDSASRLSAVHGSRSELNERFHPDSCGNRRDGSILDPANRLLERGERRFSYDPQGNLISDAGGPEPRRYRFNGRGQLSAIETAKRRIEYEYDPLGRRILKRVDGVITRFQWAGIQLLSETVEDGETVSRRDYLVCPEFLTPLAFREGDALYCVHLGRRQEPLSVTDAAGRLVWRADYRAYGQARILVSDVRQPFRLPGQYHDEETGLSYSVARYYDSELGRFLSMDPARAQGGMLNFYLYCDGDPLNRVDPTGEISLTLGAVLLGIGIGMAAGAAIGAGIELYRQRNEDHFDWGQIGLSALIGGLLGGIGGAVGVVGEAALLGVLGVIGAGAAAGALGAAAEYCVEAIGKGEWSWEDFGTSVGVGAGIGAITAGIGGIIASRAARRAAKEAEQAAAREAEEAARRAAREAEEARRAAREAEAAKRAAREADEAAKRAAREVARRAREEAEDRAQKMMEELARQEAARAALSPEKRAIHDLGPLKGKTRKEIKSLLREQGYKGPKNTDNGGQIYVKDCGNGQSAAVRVDPPARTYPRQRGYADEVAHAHKETVPTSKVEDGSYFEPNASNVTRYNDAGQPSTDPAQVHIPVTSRKGRGG
jgi:RHS repeat-associated protein